MNMSKPPFVMSKYARREDLLSDAVSYYERRAKELEAVARAMRDWIDAVPKDTPLPVMPELNHGWANDVIDVA
jgi:hypothetical protein